MMINSNRQWQRFGLAILVASFAACNRPAEQTTQSNRPAADEKGLPVLVKLPSFTLIDQSGEQFGTEQLAGKTWIGNFIFTRCTATCPVQTANLAALQERLSDGPLADVQFVSISVDPDYDTPEVLARHAKQSNADFGRWHFLTGSRDEIWELCKTGFKLPVGEAPPEAATPITHSPRFVLVDGQGNVRGFYDGTTAEGIKALNDDLGKLHETD